MSTDSEAVLYYVLRREGRFVFFQSTNSKRTYKRPASLKVYPAVCD
jgi:hypothetical protein